MLATAVSGALHATRDGWIAHNFAQTLLRTTFRDSVRSPMHEFYIVQVPGGEIDLVGTNVMAGMLCENGSVVVWQDEAQHYVFSSWVEFADACAERFGSTWRIDWVQFDGDEQA